MLAENRIFTESFSFLDSLGLSNAFNEVWKNEAVKGTTCPKSILRIFLRRNYFKLLDKGTPLYDIPDCDIFQRIDWRKYETEYGFTIQSKLIIEE